MLARARDASAIVLPMLEELRVGRLGTCIGRGGRCEFNLICTTIYEGQGLFLYPLLYLSVDLVILRRSCRSSCKSSSKLLTLSRSGPVVWLDHSQLLRHYRISLALLRRFGDH